ncbi:MAG: hypothetical protein IIY81_03435 [Lachnospiraceae bacterium]|jgi:hypothetical protein|nr:hypothetical protein [Lachnospiraceae bacterium]
MFNCGEKFSLKNLVLDVEIIGVFPASQTKDRITEYVCLVNGEKTKVKETFFEMLKKAEVKEEKVDADLKVKTEPIIVKVQEEEKPKKERKNGRKRNAKA